MRKTSWAARTSSNMPGGVSGFGRKAASPSASTTPTPLRTTMPTGGAGSGKSSSAGEIFPGRRKTCRSACRPAKKMTVAAVMNVLRGVTPADRPHGIITQETAVFQLRAEPSPALGCIYWRATGEPTVGLLLPWYLGIQDTPANYHQAVALKKALGLEHHFHPPADSFTPDRRLAWWLHESLQALVRADLHGRLAVVRAAWDPLEQRAFAHQATLEKEAGGALASRSGGRRGISHPLLHGSGRPRGSAGRATDANA